MTKTSRRKQADGGEQPKQVKCMFCGQEVDERLVIFGKTRSVNICEGCLDICNHIVADRQVTTQAGGHDMLKPVEIKAKLDEHIVDQEMAKKVISVAVYNHYKRVFNPTQVEIEKANVMLIGPTGCGKTLIARTVAKLLNVPLVIADATSLTQAGYVGRSVEDIGEQLLDAADGDVQLAERGIIFIDEIDKIAGSKETSGRDIAGEGVQQSLLKMIEGTKMIINGPKDIYGMGDQVTIDTRNILFIFGGSFAGLEEIIAQRLNRVTMGFGASTDRVKTDDKDLLRRVIGQDLIKFGMIPEFMGRVQVIVALHALTEDALVRILKEPKNSLVNQYRELLRFDGVDLEFDDDALVKIAGMAYKRHTGARGLRSIVEDTMLDLMFTAPTSKHTKVTVHAADVVDGYALA